MLFFSFFSSHAHRGLVSDFFQEFEGVEYCCSTVFKEQAGTIILYVFSLGLYLL